MTAPLDRAAAEVQVVARSMVTILDSSLPGVFHLSAGDTNRKVASTPSRPPGTR